MFIASCVSIKVSIASVEYCLDYWNDKNPITGFEVIISKGTDKE